MERYLCWLRSVSVEHTHTRVQVLQTERTKHRSCLCSLHSTACLLPCPPRSPPTSSGAYPTSPALLLLLLLLPAAATYDDRCCFVGQPTSGFSACSGDGLCAGPEEYECTAPT
jgi:hypothetical protein